jgi:hypothetical protein
MAYWIPDERGARDGYVYTLGLEEYGNVQDRPILVVSNLVYLRSRRVSRYHTAYYNLLCMS